MVVDFSKIALNDSKTPRTAAFKHIFVNYNDDDDNSSSKNIQFPVQKVKTPFGVNYIENGNDVKSTITVSLDKPEAEIVSFIKKFDKFVINEACSRSEHWFGEELEKEAIRSMFKDSLYHKNKDFPPSLTLKVPPQTIVNDENKNTIRLSSIKRGQFVNATVEIGGVWVSNNRFGISWKLVQLESLNYKPPRKAPKKQVFEFNDE